MARGGRSAEAIRDFEATQDRAWFMILSGPLMVLAVLAAVWWARRRWFRTQEVRRGWTRPVGIARRRGRCTGGQEGPPSTQPAGT